MGRKNAALYVALRIMLYKIGVEKKLSPYYAKGFLALSSPTFCVSQSSSGGSSDVNSGGGSW